MQFASFSAAADEANLARIWLGIHFRTAVVDARAPGDTVAAYVMQNAVQRLHGGGNDDDEDNGDED